MNCYTPYSHSTSHHNDRHINIRITQTLSLGFIHRAPALWYTTSSEIKNVKTVVSFSSKLKRELLKAQVQYVALRKQQNRPASRFFKEIGRNEMCLVVNYQRRYKEDRHSGTRKSIKV